VSFVFAERLSVDEPILAGELEGGLEYRLSL
jgi:hypothetical protein